MMQLIYETTQKYIKYFHWGAFTCNRVSFRWSISTFT